VFLVLTSCDPVPHDTTGSAAPPEGVNASCAGSIGDEVDGLFSGNDVYQDDHVLP